MKDFRCPKCNNLLLKVDANDAVIQIKCYACNELINLNYRATKNEIITLMKKMLDMQYQILNVISLKERSK